MGPEGPREDIAAAVDGIATLYIEPEIKTPHGCLKDGERVTAAACATYVTGEGPLALTGEAEYAAKRAEVLRRMWPYSSSRAAPARIASSRPG